MRTMPHAGFVPLRLFSAYSMLEGAIQPDTLAKAARANGFPAAGLADRGNMFAAMDFSAAAKDAGVQPVIGVMLPIERPGSRTAHTRPIIDWLVLFAQSPAGYERLIGLISRSHLDADAADEPHLKLADLDGCTDELICLTGGADGALARLAAEGQPIAPLAAELVRLPIGSTSRSAAAMIPSRCAARPNCCAWPPRWSCRSWARRR